MIHLATRSHHVTSRFKRMLIVNSESRATMAQKRISDFFSSKNPKSLRIQVNENKESDDDKTDEEGEDVSLTKRRAAAVPVQGVEHPNRREPHAANPRGAASLAGPARHHNPSLSHWLRTPQWGRTRTRCLLWDWRSLVSQPCVFLGKSLALKHLRGSTLSLSTCLCCLS